MHVRHHHRGDLPIRSDRGGGSSTLAAKRRDDGLDEIWLGSIRGSKRFILTGILASAGLFLVVWTAFLWLLIWLFPAIL
jgi:hypothetical protein